MNRNRIAKTPCRNCKEVANFSFEGCMQKCPTFLEHLKKVFAKRVSPCKDLCCGVPIVSPKKRENCEGCPLPDFFSRILESEGGGVRCVLGKKEKDRAAEYVLPWKRRKEPRYIHPKN